MLPYLAYQTARATVYAVIALLRLACGGDWEWGI